MNDRLFEEATDFRPTFEDVVMQVDVIDDKIDIWAWRPSEEMPANPLATMDDMTFDSGFVSVWVGGIGPDRDMSGTFRFVQVATQSITTIGGDSLDFNADNNVGVADLDLLVDEIARSGDNVVFDLTSDGVIDVDDLHEWLRAGAARNGFSDSYLFGDTNLDGNVDVEDLNNLALQWQQSVARWSGGDFTANGIVDSGDLNLLALNWRESIPLVTPTNGPVPEPSALFLTAVAFAFICQNNNGRNRGGIRKHLMM